ncbi:MAG TPA: DDE-type integrase/transposase/recombinase [Solirubrobacterales bacterium]
MTDITEHPTREGKVHCRVVLDAFSRLVVGWSVESTQTTVLVTNALGMATARRERADGLVIHSDRGVQFTSWSSTHPAPSLGAGDAHANRIRGSTQRNPGRLIPESRLHFSG